jgi:hypothetical protein
MSIFGSRMARAFLKAGQFNIEAACKWRHIIGVITAMQVRALLQAKPFRPFRTHLSDGTHHDITNHDTAWVMKNTVEIGLNVDPNGFAEYAVRCSILHITMLEDIAEQVAG